MRGKSRELLRDGHRAGRVLRPAPRAAAQHDRGTCRSARWRDPGDRLLLAGRGRGELPQRVEPDPRHPDLPGGRATVGTGPRTLRPCPGAGHLLGRGRGEDRGEAQRPLPLRRAARESASRLRDPTSYLPFGAAGTASKEMFQRAWQVFAHGGEDAIVPWLRNAHGLRSASKYLGPAGHVLTGGLAFADRWTEDADRKSVV